MTGRPDLGTWGRWCFLAGYLLFAAFSALYRLLDWPDWVGAIVATAVPLAALWGIDRITRTDRKD